MAAWYLVGGTNPDPPRVIAGPFSTREDAEMAECLYRYAVDHHGDAYEAASSVVSDVAAAGLHSDTGTGWFQHRYRGPEDAAATTDDGGVREREREAVAIVRAIATMTDEDLLYIPEGYAESFACRLCERWANEQGETLHKPDCLALRARALVAGMEGTNG